MPWVTEHTWLSPLGGRVMDFLAKALDAQTSDADRASANRRREAVCMIAPREGPGRNEEEEAACAATVRSAEPGRKLRATGAAAARANGALGATPRRAGHRNAMRDSRVRRGFTGRRSRAPRRDGRRSRWRATA